MGRLKSTSDASTQTEVTSTQEQGTWVNESYNATLVSELEMKEWELGEMFERLKDLERDNEDLEQRERRLDNQLGQMTLCITTLQCTKPYAFCRQRRNLVHGAIRFHEAPQFDRLLHAVNARHIYSMRFLRNFFSFFTNVKCSQITSCIHVSPANLPLKWRAFHRWSTDAKRGLRLKHPCVSWLETWLPPNFECWWKTCCW